MKIIARYAFSIVSAVSLLAGCTSGQAQNDIVPAGADSPAVRHATSSSYQQLYRFNVHQGREPLAGLIDVNGTFYGTASEGGDVGCHHPEGCGTVFSITASGGEKLIFSFTGRNGVFPESPLTDINGTFYGTARAGGARIYGAFYSVTTSGSETVLHSFHLERSDGQFPMGSLLDLHGTLYGVTVAGGHVDGDNKCEIGCGTVYSITTSGAETVLYHFMGGSDGEAPAAGLVDVKGTLYGTTLMGGSGTGCGSSTRPAPCGTVYSITPKGDYKQLYSFAGGADGANPSSALFDVNGTLYGTTRNGGGSGCGGNGCGTVFTIATSGKEKVLYRFSGGVTDGSHPDTRVIDVNGTLYGTTTQGGGSGCFADEGCGTIYSITPAGAETVLYSFAGGLDGASPEASLLDIKGTLYGTTAFGGNDKRSNCCGTIFTITP